MGFIATAVVLSGLASAGSSVYNSLKQTTASKKAAQAATDQNNAAIAANKAATDKTIADAKAAQENASTMAANRARARANASTQTIYTSPLGLEDESSAIRKTLTGQ